VEDRRDRKKTGRYEKSNNRRQNLRRDDLSKERVIESSGNSGA